MVDFTNFESVMSAIEASAGTPLSADFYLSAINGLASDLPPDSTNLFGTGETARNLIGSLSLDDPSVSSITSTDVGAFLNDPQTLAALNSSLQSGVTFNGLSDINEVLNGANADSLFGQVSLRYAQSASGDVFAILPDGADPGRIFGQVELEALLSNPSVTSILVFRLTTCEHWGAWTTPLARYRAAIIPPSVFCLVMLIHVACWAVSILLMAFSQRPELALLTMISTAWLLSKLTSQMLMVYQL